MELLYLWVDDYKNIKKQGFNFSPRFQCKYDEKTKELTIDENKKYTSIFSENINVTAVVGENGSGKSSILELLYLIYNKKISFDLLIFFDNKELKIYSKIQIDMNNYSQYNYKINNNFEKNLLSYINISHFSNEDIDTEDPNYYTIYTDIIFSYFDIDVYRNNRSDIINRYKNFKSQLIYFLLADKEKIIYMEKLIKPQKIAYLEIDFLKDTNIQSFYDENRKDISINELLYVVFSDEDPESFEDDHSFSLKLFRNFIKNFDSSVKKIIDELLSHSEVIDDRLLIAYDDFDLANSLFSLIGKDNEKYEKFELLFLNLQKERIDFSSGENLLLFYLILIEISNSIVLIDEVEIYLHPQWQKEFISLLLKNSKDKHFILTSHSPFILSDLPKENVIFLEKGKQVYPEIETFGANIHTLLSHAFFMKDGLIGEFAKNKINDAIKLLNQQKLTEEEVRFCENIISITGEPILKRQMQKMLDSKRLAKVDKIDLIEKQIAELQNELTKMKK